jgi:phosphoserine phosphatase RsbU/P
MDVAHTIQMGLLPKIFPDRPDCRISALLEPVRAVGGDLYDFFITNDDQVFLAIGDVAGKGVPAALFMAVTKTLFRSTIAKGETISSTMESMNRELSRENPNMMFVTFAAIVLDLKTGMMEVCNAGHTQPLILRRNGSVEKITHLGGIPLGIDESTSYSSTKITLDPNDTVILYTDGITEAFNAGNKLYGEESLIGSLQGIDGNSDIPGKLIGDVRKFRGEAEPSDDIAILVMKYTDHLAEPAENAAGTDSRDEKEILYMKNEIGEMHNLIAKLDELIARWSIPVKTGNQIHLAMEELVSNIIFYAYPDKEEHLIEIEFSLNAEGLKIVTTDDGLPFNILDQAEPADTTATAEERPVGGLGIHFIKSIMDFVGYKRINDRNQVIMLKKT